MDVPSMMCSVFRRGRQTPAFHAWRWGEITTLLNFVQAYYYQLLLRGLFETLSSSNIALCTGSMAPVFPSLVDMKPAYLVDSTKNIPTG